MMSDAFVVAVEGLDVLKDYETLPAKIEQAARRAVSRTTDRTRTAAARAIREQVNFPARYLSSNDGRLEADKSQLADLTGIVRGRHRPTSLARFLVGNPEPSRAGVRVAVKPGGARFLPRAFAVRLRSGTENLDTKSNLGLAIRTPNGERPKMAYKPSPLGPGLWLLFGPSIDQVFRTVAGELIPETQDFLDAEFRRLLELDGIR